MILLALACSTDVGIISNEDSAVGTDAAPGNVDDGCAVVGDRPEGWSEAQDDSTDPDYDKVFDAGRVQKMYITVGAEDYAAMYAEMEELMGVAFGAGSQQGGPGQGQQGGQGGPPDDGEGGGVDLIGGDPSYVAVKVEAGDQRWCRVGMRFKGNSSRSQSWSAGIGKLPFRLNFDHFEDTYPEIDDQRFYGFKEISAGSNVMDDTTLRNVLASEILEDRGVPAARNGFWEVYVDSGDGPVYWGLYTMMEDPSDAMMDRVFGEDGGNMYKPEGTCATLACFDEESFEKKSNEEDADWSDVTALVAALNEDGLTAADWRAGLDARMDTGAFLRWLAVNNAIENWDTYGQIAHNFYLYAREDDGGRIQWIPWDHDLSQQAAMRGDSDVWMDSTGDEWPLLRRLLDDPVYADTYAAELALALEGAYAQDAYEARIDALAEVVRPSLFGAESGGVSESEGFTGLTTEDAWEASLESLKAHGVSRRAEVAEAIGR